jgi:hypothetical protein
MSRVSVRSQGLYATLVEKRGTYGQIVLANQLEVGQLTVEARQEEVDDLHLEVAAATRMEMGKRPDVWEAELYIPGGS